MTRAGLALEQDAYGREILAYHHGEESFEIVERSDGYFDVSSGPAAYFDPFEAWPAYEREALSFAHGRVLDIGCGAGRVGLALQERGLPVLGIDNSPLALEVCRLRGMKSVHLASIDQLGSHLGRFDTVVMYGNNFGLFGTFARARELLQSFHAFTSPRACILAESNDPYVTREPEHLAYQAENQARGRMSGQLQIRIRFKKYCTPWFDYLIVSPTEMQEIVAGTGWRIERFFKSPDASMYVALLEKDNVRIGAQNGS